MLQDQLLRLIDGFRRAFPDDPSGALRDFLRVEGRLREDGDEQAIRALTDALWLLAPEIPFRTPDERAAFFHSFALFLGSPGPSADLDRALEAFEVPLRIWTKESAPERYARVIHDLATTRQSVRETRRS